MSSARYHIQPAARGLLLDLGISIPDVLRRASLPADLFARTPLTMSPPETYALWQAMADEVGDPALPVSIARALRTEVFQVPIFAALCSPDLGVAAERIAAHKRLVGPIRLRVDRDGDGLELAPSWPPDHTPPQVFVLTELLFWVALVRIATRAEIRPMAITAPEPPRDQAAYRDYLGIEVARGDRPTITFSRMDANRPFLTADEGMWDFFAPELRRRLSELDAAVATADRVRATLHELLPAGDASMQGTARQLAVSTRTLQRRLKEEGTTFQDVLADTRESLARHYLTSSTMPAAEIAFLLGYEDTNSFYRAFQSWTGDTPQGIREAVTA